MKWVLIDKFDNIVHTVDLNKGYTQNEARKYFVNLKQIDEKEFNKLWKVKPEEEYDLNQMAFKRPPSSDPNRRWWLEDSAISNDELKMID